MDTELRQLEQSWQQSGDPLTRAKLDVARSRAGLPTGLAFVEETRKEFEKNLRENLRTNLEYDLSEYMRKYGSVVEYIRWYQMNGTEVSWEVGDTTWIDAIRVMFKLDLRILLFEGEDPFDDASDDNGEICSDEDSKDLESHIYFRPEFAAQRNLMVAAVKEADLLCDHIRSFMREFGELFGEDVYVVYNCKNQLTTLDSAQFDQLVESLSRE